MKKFLFIFLFFLIFLTTTDTYAQRLKFGTEWTMNTMPDGLSHIFPLYGFKTSFEMKYLYSGIGALFVNSSVIYFEIGPKIPIYSGKTFYFSIPLSFVISYFDYYFDVGDGYYDHAKVLLLGGSPSFNFDWVFKNGFGVYFYVAASFSRVVLNKTITAGYDHDSLHYKNYFYVHTGSGISYGF